ncbi:MAG: glycosyl hydrolase family 28 protein [Lachnospiraceae bacterium]
MYTKRKKKVLLIGMILSAIIIMIPCMITLAEKNTKSDKKTTLITYSSPNPSDVEQPTDSKVQYEWSDYYSVKVRPEGDDENAWEELQVFKARVQNTFTQEAAFVYFDCDGPVEVQVTCNKETTLNEETVVNPMSANVIPAFSADSNVLSFVVRPNQKLVVDPNGDPRHSLHIYANNLPDFPDEDELKDKTVTYVDASKGDTLQWQYDTDVIYIKPGFYNNSFSVKSNQTCYIEGGTVIRGSVYLDRTENARLIGHAVFYRPDGRAISLDDCENAYVEGVIVSNYGAMDWGGCLASVSNSKNVTIKDVKSIACNKWSDAIDIFTSEDVTVEDCFIRSGDDCIALYGPRWNGKYWGDTGNVRNINVSGCILMPDKAHPVNIGTHGDATSANGGRVFDNINFQDLDVLTYNTHAVDGDGVTNVVGCIRFNACDGNMITNVYFENIHIQDGARNSILDMDVNTTGYGSVIYPGRGIHNVYFKDVTYTNPNAEFPTTIKGYNDSSLVKNITFENLVVNGKVATAPEDAQITLGNYTENIRFVESGESVYMYNPAIVPEDIWPEYYDYAQCDGVSVSATYSENNSEPVSVIDEKDDTVWYSHTGSSEPNTAYSDGDALEGLTIDLGSVRKLKCLRITWKDKSAYKYRIFVSKDGVEWGARSDEQEIGALNPKADADYKRVKWNWFGNQRYELEGRYVKIVPCDGYRLAIAELAVLGVEEP